MKHIVFITGAGMSQESGISTFRDSNGLWENHSIEEVASPIGFAKNPTLVLNFYNQRRKQLFDVSPNKGHQIIADLEKEYRVTIVTQNVDDLHERAGSTNVLHLHGELRKVRSTQNEKLIYNWDKDLNLGDLCEEGTQLRPHIVWFGEAVPLIEDAIKIIEDADVVVVIGTSMQVYPAAGLIDFKKTNCPLFYIDPNPENMSNKSAIIIPEKASKGMQLFVKDHLLSI